MARLGGPLAEALPSELSLCYGDSASCPKMINAMRTLSDLTTGKIVSKGLICGFAVRYTPAVFIRPAAGSTHSG
ncbi:MAG: hypothetical protein HOB84_09630 [Candidatus Marinimicrobia bacterium]|nr:hypothetical protein [Candidatus Neomarinimicrobiota bacterium]